MYLVDANVLLYAINRDSMHHTPANEWLTGSLAGARTVGMPWLSLLAFLRIATNGRIMPRPLTTPEAFALIETWLASPSAVLTTPGARHLTVLRGLVETAGTAGNLTSDAHLAALALERGATVATFDRDFERFGVRVTVPG